MVGIWQGVILTIEMFLKAKDNILKSKLAWPACTKSMKLKLRTKMVLQQWQQVKVKYVLGYSIKTII